MKKIMLIFLCIGTGLSTGSFFVLDRQKQPDEETWADGPLIVRHVGTSVSNTVAIEEFIKQLPFSETLDDVSIEQSTVRMSYQVTGKERIDWLGVDTETINRNSLAFLEGRLSKLIMHHTLALFSSISDLAELQIRYRDPFSEITFHVDRLAVEDYTPQDIDRASSSANRFNRVVIEDYVLVDSRRRSFLKTFKEELHMVP